MPEATPELPGRGPRPQCCAIIPAWNEAGRVGAVVTVAVRSGLFSEVVVVDDGSTDSTADEARQAGAHVISHARNAGKAQSMLTGLRATTSPLVCFLDADLTGVTPEHLALLVDPVVEGKLAAALAVFSGGRAVTSLAQKISPMLSGQRCLRRELLNNFSDWNSGFGIETAINNHLLSIDVNQQLIPWLGAAQVMKEEKRGCLPGFLSRLRMYWEIICQWCRTQRKR